MGQALEDIQWTYRDSLKDQQDILSIGKNSRLSKESKNHNLRNSVQPGRIKNLERQFLNKFDHSVKRIDISKVHASARAPMLSTPKNFHLSDVHTPHAGI